MIFAFQFFSVGVYDPLIVIVFVNDFLVIFVPSVVTAGAEWSGWADGR